ncbi:MAG TPA: phospholipid scramblase-related protein [Bdellovibrionales bacterium]|nr:phospholipid scramblase-related protein [Bdellovibrionales bacterium]
MNLPTESGSLELQPHSKLLVHQIHEVAELFGFETRNKYEILDESGRQVAWAAEQQKGFLGFLLRHFLGHWRSFTIQIFDAQRRPVILAKHPFRFFFQRLEIFDATGRPLGSIQQRFSILSKRFDVENERGMTLFEVASPIWRIWTFTFLHAGRPVATVAKKWTGALFELFTDKDKFLVDFSEGGLSESERKLILAAALFIDLQYFERKAN